LQAHEIKILGLDHKQWAYGHFDQQIMHTADYISTILPQVI